MRMQWMLAAMMGLGLAACAANKEAKEEKEGPEIKMTMDQVPAAVKDGITREAGGAAIANVDKQSSDGKTMYEADAMIGGKNYEIIVAEDGSLIAKKLDDEAAEKKGAESKDSSEKKETEKKD